MTIEAPRIEFASEADVRSKAEHQRTEELAAWLKMAFAGWAHRRREQGRAVFAHLPQYVMTPGRPSGPDRIS